VPAPGCNGAAAGGLWTDHHYRGNGVAAFSGDGGPATAASLVPGGIAFDGSGNLFIADSGISNIRRVDAGTGIITSVAGTATPGFSGDGGPATAASLRNPSGIAIDGSGNLFISDHFNHRIRRVDGSTGIITTVAGNGTAAFSGDGGPATAASLNQPDGLAFDGSGNLFIAMMPVLASTRRMRLLIRSYRGRQRITRF
jgi:sugar lactone lactonase YvrE